MRICSKWANLKGVSRVREKAVRDGENLEVTVSRGLAEQPIEEADAGTLNRWRTALKWN